MQKLEVVKPARLNGNDVQVGEKVEVEDHIARFWLKLGIAKVSNEQSSGNGSDKITNQQNEADYPLLMILGGNADEIVKNEFKDLSKEQLQELLELEFKGKMRKTVINHIENLLAEFKE